MTEISEKTKVSWPVVVMLLGTGITLAFSAGISYLALDNVQERQEQYEVRNSEEHKTIHSRIDKIEDKVQADDSRDQVFQAEVKATLGAVKDTVNQINNKTSVPVVQAPAK